jgi:hypothetical protein
MRDRALNKALIQHATLPARCEHGGAHVRGGLAHALESPLAEPSLFWHGPEKEKETLPSRLAEGSQMYAHASSCLSARRTKTGVTCLR